MLDVYGVCVCVCGRQGDSMSVCEVGRCTSSVAYVYDVCMYIMSPPLDEGLVVKMKGSFLVSEVVIWTQERVGWCGGAPPLLSP